MNAFTDSFVFGLANSVHCACMCGPLALSMHGGIGAGTGYHFSRLLAYALVGGLLGIAGAAVGSEQLGTPTATVAFVLAGGILVLVFAGDRLAVRVPWLGTALQRGMARARALPPVWRGAALGLLTPLLPCGLLWAACAAAAVAGSAAAGATVMAGFALGAIPLLSLAQLQAGWLRRRFGARGLLLLQRGAMLLAAAALIWRGVSNSGGSCCH